MSQSNCTGKPNIKEVHEVEWTVEQRIFLSWPIDLMLTAWKFVTVKSGISFVEFKCSTWRSALYTASFSWSGNLCKHNAVLWHKINCYIQPVPTWKRSFIRQNVFCVRFTQALHDVWSKLIQTMEHTCSEKATGTDESSRFDIWSQDGQKQPNTITIYINGKVSNPNLQKKRYEFWRPKKKRTEYLFVCLHFLVL